MARALDRARIRQEAADDEVAQRIRAGIERVYGGIDNKFKIAILELGMKLKRCRSNRDSPADRDAQRAGAVQACTMYRTPPHKIGIARRRRTTTSSTSRSTT
jgi:hypothetical protein